MKRLILLVLLFIIGSCAEDYQDEFDNLNAQIAELKNIQSNFSTIINSMESVKSTIATLETKISDIENNTVVIHSLISTLTANQNQIKSTLTELGIEIKNAQTVVNQITEVVESTEKNQIDENFLKELEQRLTKVIQEEDQEKFIDIDENFLKELEQRLTKVIQEEDQEKFIDQLNTINQQIEALKNQLELLVDTQADFYSGSPEISTTGSLNFFHSIKTNLKYIQGNFTVRTLQGMDIQKLNEIISSIDYISGNLIIQAQNKDGPPVYFDNIEAVDGNILIHQVGNIDFPKLVKVNNLVISDRYEASINSVAFPLLEGIKSFSTGPLDSAVALFSNGNHTIELNHLNDLNLGSLVNYPNSLTIKIANDGAINLKKLESIETNPKTPIRTLTIQGPKLAELHAFKDGKIVELEDVFSAEFPAFKGHLKIASDVGLVKAKVNELTIATNNDLERLELESINNQFKLDTSDLSDLEEFKFDGLAEEIKLINNSDLKSIDLRGEIKIVHVINSDVDGYLNLNHINLDKEREGTLKVIDNGDITTLRVPNINNLQVLEIQSNEELSSIEFPALSSAQNKLGEVSIKIGGLGFENDLSATQIIEFEDDSDEKTNPVGVIRSGSGLTELSSYFQSALSKNGDISVYFDRADSFQEGKDNPTSIVEITTENQNNLLLIRRVGNKATEGIKAKRGFVITPESRSPSVTIKANGVEKTIQLTEGGSSRNWAEQIKEDEEDSNFFSVNDVDIDVFAGGIPQSTITSDLVDTPLTQANIDAMTNTITDEAPYIQLTIGNPSELYSRSHTLFLDPTQLSDDFEPEIFTSKLFHATSLIELTTSMNQHQILDTLISAFPNAINNSRTRGGGVISPTKPGNIDFNIESIPNTFNYVISAYDQSDRFDGIPVEITSNIRFGTSNIDPTGGLKSLQATRMKGNSIVVTLESNILGATNSVIGQPTFVESQSRKPNPVDNASENVVYITPGSSVELYSKGDYGGRRYLRSPERTRTGVDVDLNESGSFILYKLDWIE